MANLNTEPIQVGDKIRLATWNYGGLSFTQRELCGELGYDILALMETHDTGSLRHSKQAPSASDTLAELETLLSKVNRHECVVFIGDSNAKLARRTDRMTCRWCIHRRANPAGDRLLGLMDRLQLCVVSTLHQLRRDSTNATYLSKDPPYGPSQIDYVTVSYRWATSTHKCEVGVGVSFKRWERRCDHGLVSCVWVCANSHSTNVTCRSSTRPSWLKTVAS